MYRIVIGSYHDSGFVAATPDNVILPSWNMFCQAFIMTMQIWRCVHLWNKRDVWILNLVIPLIMNYDPRTSNWNKQIIKNNNISLSQNFNWYSREIVIENSA